jgi:hypothetical protein
MDDNKHSQKALALTTVLPLKEVEAKNSRSEGTRKLAETPSQEVLKRRARQTRYYERKKLSLKKEDIERRRLARENREARRAERQRQAELKASQLPAPQLDKTAQWNEGFCACFLSVQPNIEALEAEIRKLKAQIKAGV